MAGTRSASRGPDDRAASRYLIRLDDACPTMPRGVWDRVEATLAGAGISPLVAVIPDNRDPQLLVDEPDPRFWERVRGWQVRGWAIGLHGLHHVMTRRRGRNTEFAGVPAARQEERLDAALGIFAREGVRPDAWTAPNHSFDRSTVRILVSRGVDVISDGYAVFPYRSQGALWVPQQLWGFQHRPTGVWTVCRHPNGWGEEELSRFERDVGRFADRTIDLSSIVERYAGRRRDVRDLVFLARRRAKSGALRPVRAVTSRRHHRDPGASRSIER